MGQLSYVVDHTKFEKSRLLLKHHALLFTQMSMHNNDSKLKELVTSTCVTK